jgi:hypothetical protein
MGVEGSGRRETGFLPRAGIDLVVNAASFLAFAGLAITGLFFMDGERGAAKGLHELLGYVMVALVAVHVVRHSRWISSVTAGRLLGDAASRRRTWAAVALTACAFAAIAAGSLLAGDGRGDGRGHEEHRRSAHVR